MIPGKTIIGGSSAEHARHASDFYETPDEYERLRFADRLDAYMWAKHHAPHVLDGDGWPECRHRLFVQAEARGVAVAL